MELVVVVGGKALSDQLVELGHRPAVQLQHLLRGHQVIGVKAVQVAQAVPGGIAELQIVLAELLKDVVRTAHVHMVVGRTRPQPEQVGTILLKDLRGVYAVAQGLVHSLALAVHGPAVGDALLEGSPLAQRAHGGEQGGLEPAAVLVQTLHIHVGGPEILVLLHGGEVGGAGVEPAVQGVLLLGEARP